MEEKDGQLSIHRACTWFSRSVRFHPQNCINQLPSQAILLLSFRNPQTGQNNITCTAKCTQTLDCRKGKKELKGTELRTNAKPAVEACRGRAGAGDSCCCMAQITSQGASSKTSTYSNTSETLVPLSCDLCWDNDEQQHWRVSLTQTVAGVHPGLPWSGLLLNGILGKTLQNFCMATWLWRQAPTQRCHRYLSTLTALSQAWLLRPKYQAFGIEAQNCSYQLSYSELFSSLPSGSPTCLDNLLHPPFQFESEH